MRPRTYHALSEINVTNLVDVVLVLLIIFMVTAPLLQSGIEVRLPRTTATAEEPSEGIVVSITKEGGVFINDVYRTADQWEDELKRVIAVKPGQKAYVRADSSVGYGLVVQVLGTMKRLGLEEVGLVTRPIEDENKPKPGAKIKWG
ncbi:MAG: biopolymer transporter ExbD [candidate division Zixibacteria bacterium]|nr:biopolymer transporter ExbD [candidate division Zixibacteria bacterium]